MSFCVAGRAKEDGIFTSIWSPSSLFVVDDYNIFVLIISTFLAFFAAFFKQNISCSTPSSQFFSHISSLILFEAISATKMNCKFFKGSFICSKGFFTEPAFSNGMGNIYTQATSSAMPAFSRTILLPKMPLVKRYFAFNTNRVRKSWFTHYKSYTISHNICQGGDD